MDYWKCPGPTHIEERVDATGTVSDDEERIAGHLIAGVLGRLVELVRVRDHDPCFAEYGPPLSLVEARLLVL